MKYTRKDPKSHAFAHMNGIWAAGLMPFSNDLSMDEEGFAANTDHWINDLGIDGCFIAGKKGEFFAISLDKRKREFDIFVDFRCCGAASDQPFASIWSAR